MGWIGPHPIERYRRLRGVLRRGCLAVGFWGAIVLPVATLPVVVLTPAATSLVAGLIGLDVVCLVVGQHYEPGDGIAGLGSETTARGVFR